ncbi:hypothetical protein AZE42_00712 [Rhizopogon vesiculosus]|uniref:Uncharacterized protein n=1 Tax=Rhizopogon vesiculosus TaxID=180088 RepID=A0A1J8QIF5_9AGAM|nr:hypothetical protein AZE42_00712 [Rhizopogon vesiculosus]
MKLRRLDFAAEPLRKDIAMTRPKWVHNGMVDAQLANGDIQPLYFPDGHEKAGHSKGMAQNAESSSVLVEGQIVVVGGSCTPSQTL